MPARIVETVRERLDRHSIPEPNSGCHLWTACIASHGYGVVRHAGSREVTAHRMSWEDVNGPIPTGLHVLHKCDVRTCINPDHLFLGTHADNMHDMFAKGRRAAKGMPGESNHAAKLDEEKVRAIRADTRKRANAKLAREYEVHASLIGLIRKGKIWRHVQ